MKSKTVRKLALEILLRLERKEIDVSKILDECIREQQLKHADKSLLTELVYGVFRWRGRLDWIIKQFTSGKKVERKILNVLRLGVYQLLLLDKIPPYAAINETVELAKPHRMKRSFVNAVLRQIQRERANIKYPDATENPIYHLAVVLSYPEWLVERWVKRHGFDWTYAFCEVSNRIAPLSIRTNTLRIDRESLAEMLKQGGVCVHISEIVPEGLRLTEYPSLRTLDAYKDGLFQVQDESSMLVSHILGPKPGERILDVCSAPGGKTTHIAQLMKNRGEILALDISETRLALVKQNCKRLGIKIVKTVKADAREISSPTVSVLSGCIPSLKTNIAATLQTTKEHNPAFDRVLVDAPCSALGTLRRHPDVRWRRTPEQICALSKLQLDILKNASKYVKQNGILVYSTCTIEPEENENVVMKFLSEFPQFQLESVSTTSVPCEIENLISDEGYMRSYPHLYDMDGSFVALMRLSSNKDKNHRVI